MSKKNQFALKNILGFHKQILNKPKLQVFIRHHHQHHRHDIIIVMSIDSSLSVKERRYLFVFLFHGLRKAEQELLYEREKLEAAFDQQLQREVSTIVD